MILERLSSDRTSRGLVLARVVVLVTIIVGIPHFPSSAVQRYLAIAHTPGIPYRAFQVEYPLGELLLIKLTSFSSEALGRVSLGIIAFGADIAAFLAVRARAGVAAGRRYLVIGTPLLIYIYRRSDLVSVAVSAIAVWALERRRDRASGASFALGVLLKLWPIVLIPALFIQRKLRAVKAFAFTLVCGLAIWGALGGVDAPRQVLTFRGATGWEIESTVGTLVWIATGERRFEAGAWRAGLLTPMEQALGVIAMVALLAAIWWRASTREIDVWGIPAAASVAALLFTSPLLSPGYVAWLLPWVAMSGRSRFRALGAVPIILTGVIVCVWYLDIWRGHPFLTQISLVARNVSLIPIIVAGVLARRDDIHTRGPAGPIRVSNPLGSS